MCVAETYYNGVDTPTGVQSRLLLKHHPRGGQCTNACLCQRMHHMHDCMYCVYMNMLSWIDAIVATLV